MTLTIALPHGGGSLWAASDALLLHQPVSAGLRREVAIRVVTDLYQEQGSSLGTAPPCLVSSSRLQPAEDSEAGLQLICPIIAGLFSAVSDDLPKLQVSKGLKESLDHTHRHLMRCYYRRILSALWRGRGHGKGFALWRDGSLKKLGIQLICSERSIPDSEIIQLVVHS